MRVRDRVEGTVTEAHQFDGQDEGGQLRAALAQRSSVPDGAEIVVGSWRLYLPQYTSLPDASTEIETEIHERYDWLVWFDEEQRWENYTPKLFARYFEEIPDGES